MVAVDASQGDEEVAAEAVRGRSPLLTFGVGAAMLLGVSAAVLFGSEFFAADPTPQAGISLKLAPAPVPAPAMSAPAFQVAAPRSLNGYLIADPALIEDSPFGPLPTIAPDGRAPMTAYARPYDAAETRKRIAVIVGGLDVSAAHTKLALARLPPQVTLAFVPFVAGPRDSVDRAREAGHEVLLEVPMEPFDFPESDPGPYALMAAASGEENIRRLQWSLSRFTGYVGLVNLLGARFMSEQAAVEPVLREFSRRGLVFVDTGASRSSLTLTAARRAQAHLAIASLRLDDVQNREGVDQRLGELEAEARRSGSAIGIGWAFPVTIARIADWAETVESRGFTLVPITALAVKPAQP